MRNRVPTHGFTAICLQYPGLPCGWQGWAHLSHHQSSCTLAISWNQDRGWNCTPSIFVFGAGIPIVVLTCRTDTRLEDILKYHHLKLSLVFWHPKFIRKLSLWKYMTLCFCSLFLLIQTPSIMMSTSVVASWKHHGFPS